jgi:hypothetical protein
MDQQGYGEVSNASTGAGSAQFPPGVAVYDADGEQLGTVSDWQEMHNFLIVHQGRLFGHDTYVPHAAIKYSDMNGVHLRLRQGDLTRMKQPPLPEQATRLSTLSVALPILVPDMGVAAVAASAFAHDATSSRASVSNSSAQSAIGAVQQNTMQANRLPDRGKSRRLWRRSNK